MKTGKVTKVLAILGFISAGIWIGVFSYFMIVYFTDLFLRGFRDWNPELGSPTGRWIFLILFLGGYISGIVCLAKAKKNRETSNFAFIGSLLLVAGSIFVLILGTQIHKWFKYGDEPNRSLSTSQLILSILALLLWIAHFVATALSNPRIKALLVQSDLRPAEDKEERIEEETPAVVKQEDITERLSEAKAMLDEGLIDSEDFKKIKEHILESGI